MSEGEKKDELTPNEDAYHSFMGGANAGGVLVRKSETVSDGAVKQICFEYLADLNDAGDLPDFLLNIKSVGFDFLPDLNRTLESALDPHPKLGNMSHWRVYTKTPKGLFVSSRPGRIFSGEVYPVGKGFIRATGDLDIAGELFSRIQNLPVQSKGRQLFSTFASLWQKDPDKFEWYHQ